VEKMTLKCPSVLVKMSICPVKMLFLAANQLPGTIAHATVGHQQLNWLLEGK